MKWIIYFAFLSLLPIQVNLKSISATTCSEVATSIINWIEHDMSNVMSKRLYERTFDKISNNPSFEVLKDRDKLTKTVCMILNAKSMRELSKKLSETIFKDIISASEISYLIRRKYKYLKPYLEDGKFQLAFKYLNELLKYIRENIINENVSKKSEFIEKFTEIINDMSLKYGRKWWNDRESLRLINHLFRSLNLWMSDDNSKGAVSQVIAKYFNVTDTYNYNSYKYLLIDSLNLLRTKSEDEINKILQSYKTGFEIIKFFYLNNVFTLPVCSYDKTIDKFVTTFIKHKELIKTLIPLYSYSFFVNAISEIEIFKNNMCSILYSKDKIDFNNNLAMYLGIPRLYVESDERLISPFLHSASFFLNTIEICEKLFSFIKKTNIILEWPIKIQIFEIKQFLDDLLNSYGENWLKYVDVFNQLVSNDFKMTKSRNDELAKNFVKIDNDHQLLISLGLSENSKLRYFIEEFRHFVLHERASVNLDNIIKLSKNIWNIYKDLEEIGIIELIKAPDKKCDASKHEIIGNVLKFFNKNKYILSKTLYPILEKNMHTRISHYNLPIWISKFLCILLESSEENFQSNFFGYIGSFHYYYYGGFINTIIKIDTGKLTNDFSESMEVWITVLEGYEKFHKMRANGERTEDIMSFVENRLRNMTKLFGPYWTAKLNPNVDGRYDLYYSFSGHYSYRKVTRAIVETHSIEEFNDKMNFSYQATRESSKMIFEIVETLVKNNWRKIIPVFKEFHNLLIQFIHTNAMSIMMKVFHVNH
ncbi:DgyrCDS14635 [Dimorphilus gyrociliatus]|uniref:DgyrCDS14635 n=1 Tax=Dimorphilus gyrociliatus TaxID=2664684 RepID=A0A7I8WEC3_9ANNE|nr:DgyrCDS14635 [Dimorphilus gyrociliatus]